MIGQPADATNGTFALGMEDEAHRWRIVDATWPPTADDPQSSLTSLLEVNEGSDLLGVPRWSLVSLADDNEWGAVLTDFVRDKVGDALVPEGWVPLTRERSDRELTDEELFTPELAYENPARSWRIVAWWLEPNNERAIYRVHSVEVHGSRDLLGGERWFVPPSFAIDALQTALQEWLDEKLHRFYGPTDGNKERAPYFWEW